MAAQWPRVVDQLVAMLPNLTGWADVTIFDGPLLSDDVTTSYCTVGYVATDNAGSYSQTQDPDGFQLRETGDVRCELVCMATDGGTDLAALRTQAFALASAFEDAIRADRRLGGVLSAEGTVDLTTEVHSIQTAVGAFQTLIFAVTYFTVT